MCHDLFSFLIAIVFSECLKIKKGALNLFPSSKRLCFMSCSIHGYFGLSIPDLKKNQKNFPDLYGNKHYTVEKKCGIMRDNLINCFCTYL